MNTELLDAAARLLLDIAGPAPHHIEMSARGPKKYYSVKRVLTLEDVRQHLRGIKTRGALCEHPGDQARALAYDADDPERWQQLQAAAQALAAAGYRPLLEPSPRGRGGHLWIIYNTLIDASAARSHAHSIAPELASIAEYWPGPASVPAWNRIRLPGGRYVAPPDFSAWCKLYDAEGQELARDGMSAARVLLDYQTPAELLPALPPDHPRDGDASPPVTPDNTAQTGALEQATKRNTSPLRNGPAAANRFLWFRYSPVQLAEWFNSRHSLTGLHLPERGRGNMAFSPSVQERTPSTSYYDTPSGERWTDFSAKARRGDGHPDGGDALELYVRLQGGSKAAVLRELGREMVREARAELEAAARTGVQPPGWVSAIMTLAGWEHYRKVAQARSQEPPT